MTQPGPDQGIPKGPQEETAPAQPPQHHQPMPLDTGRARVNELLAGRAEIQQEYPQYTLEQITRIIPPLTNAHDQIAFLTVIKSLETSRQEKEAATDYFIQANQRLVATIVNGFLTGYPNRTLLERLGEKDDLINTGNVALLNALGKSRIETLSERGFGNYAAKWIRGAIIEEAFRVTHQIFIPVDRRKELKALMQAQDHFLNLGITNPTKTQLAEYLGLTPAEGPAEIEERLADLMLYSVQSYQVSQEHGLDASSEHENEPADTTTANPEEQALQITPAEVQALLQEVITHPRWLKALTMHEYDEQSQEDIGKELKVSPERIRQILQRARQVVMSSEQFKKLLREE